MFKPTLCLPIFQQLEPLLADSQALSEKTAASLNDIAEKSQVVLSAGSETRSRLDTALARSVANQNAVDDLATKVDAASTNAATINTKVGLTWGV